MIRLLEKMGFTDIEENEDGTVDATKSGVRYCRMYISGYKTSIEENSEIVESSIIKMVHVGNKTV